MLLSIIIPLAPGEQSWRKLLEDFQHISKHETALKNQTEILLASPETNLFIPTYNDLKIKLVKTSSGRAKSMNCATETANGEYLWFVHADTRLSIHSCKRFFETLKERPQTLMYFDLAFTGQKRMAFNAIGLKWRSRLCHCPFGDQAFCISKQQFQQANKYPEDALYGEDHLFVWQVRTADIPLQALKTTINTSARKYEKQGWIFTTLQHWYFWLKQAIPAYINYRKNKASKS